MARECKRCKELSASLAKAISREATLYSQWQAALVLKRKIAELDQNAGIIMDRLASEADTGPIPPAQAAPPPA